MKNLFLSVLLCVALSATAEPQSTGGDDPPRETLFAAEITVGPAWDSSKEAHDQAYFREHSDKLKRLREDGSLIMGARYSDKGLIVLQASSAEDAHAMMRQDVSIQNGVFRYELHEFNVFYSGTVPSR